MAMPDNVSLSGIEFTIKGSSDAASESVKKLTQELNNLKEALKKSEGIGGLATSLKKLENINTTMLSVANTILSEMSQLDFSNIREAAEGIKDIAAAARQIAGMGKSEQPLQEVIGEPDKIRTAIGYLQEFGQAMAGAAKYGAQLAGKGLAGIGKMLALPFKQAIPKVKSYAQALGGVVRSFGRILGYRIVRSIIREVTQAFSEGIKNLYAWSSLVNGEFKDSMDSIATSLLYFKNSIGAAVAPIINALAPAIDFLVDKIVDLINVINQLFAKLTGAAYWTRAIKKTTEYEDAISGAGGAAKEALKYLAPFDELNRLPSEKKGGGGGGSADDPSGMFETVTEFEDTIANFADNIRAAIQAGDWQAVGTLLGDKVNEVVDSIDFAGAGARVGTAINAWFTTKYWTLDTINFTNIGSKIAEAFNGAIGQIDFEIIGRTLVQKFTKLGDAIIGAVETIDWGQVAASTGDLISGFWKEVGDWFQETDFATLASSIWQGIKDAVTNVDWAEVATSIFRAIGSAIGAAASFVAQLAKDMLTDLWNAIVNASKTWDNDGDGELTGREIINGIWEGIKTAVKNVGTWIKDNIFTPFINGIKSAFGINSPAEKMKPYGGYIAEGIKEGIKNVFSNIKTWVSDNILKPLQNAIDTAKEKITVGIGLVRKGWDYVSTWIKDNFMGASTPQKGIGIVRKGWDFVSNWIKNNWMGQSTPQKGVGIIRKGFDYVSTWIKDNWMGQSTPTKGIGIARKGWDFVSTWIKDNWMGASTPNKGIGIVQKGWDYVSNWIKNNWMGNSNPTQDIGLGKSGWYSVTDWVSNAVTGTVSQATSLFINGSTISDRLSYYGNFLADAYLNIIGQANTPTVQANLVYSSSGREHGTSYGNFAKGGAFYGGNWHDIPQYAAGTTRAHGSLFLAGEAGPEVVGHVGGRTEVLNRSQLAATMYASVRNAMASVSSRMAGSPAGNYYADAESNEETMYRAFSRALADSDLGGDIELDGNVLYRAMVNRNRANTRLTGVNAMA